MVAIRSDKRKTSHVAFTKQDPWKTQTAGIMPRRNVICSEKSSYEGKVSGKKPKKNYINFFHVGVIQGISLLKRPSGSSTLVTVMLLLLQ